LIGLIILGKELRHGTAQSWLAFTGLFVIVLFTVNDIIHYINIPILANTSRFISFFNIQFTAPIGMVFFVFCYALLLALKYADTERIASETSARVQIAAADNAVLSQLNRAKTEFIANASHEMRTPLTVISVNVQTVKNIIEDMGDVVESPDAEKLLKNAQSEIMRLARMVDGMLKLSSISDGADKSKLDLSELLHSVADMLRIHLHERGNEVKTEIETDLDIFGDADLLSQVAINLIQNAQKHTENDTITISAARDGSVITITVRDSGTGISPALLPRVFERGVSDGGTGFGLYFCKAVVESHGGEIWIESEPGKGTGAYFTLPVYEGQYGD
jgi:signal transduction histidine kinase